MKYMSVTIGVDFDNTIAGYDRLIYDIAVAEKLIDPAVSASKKSVRDAVRRGPAGEAGWRRVQAKVYGPEMRSAVLMDGAWEFFIYCRENGIRTYIVSHKTEFADFDESQTNLREAAMNWMENLGFFSDAGLGINRAQVFFEPTRGKKIERIKRLECGYFIDDLEEVFMEETFPDDVRKILLAPPGNRVKSTDTVRFASWKEIIENFSAGAI